MTPCNQRCPQYWCSIDHAEPCKSTNTSTDDACLHSAVQLQSCNILTDHWLIFHIITGVTLKTVTFQEVTSCNLVMMEAAIILKHQCTTYRLPFYHMCPSICPCLSTWLPLDDLLYNLIFASSLKSCWENPNFLMWKCNISLQSLGGQNIKESQLCWTPKWTWVVGLTSCPIFFVEKALITTEQKAG